MANRTLFALAIALVAIAVVTARDTPDDKKKEYADDGKEKCGANTTTLAMSFLKSANVTGIENSTIFAPCDKAFMKLAKKLNVTDTGAFLQAPLSNTSLSILQMHVIPGKVIKAADVTGNTTLTTLGGQKIRVWKDGDEVEVAGEGNKDEADVKAADIPFGTNIVHVIDKVLLPKPQPNVTAAGGDSA